MTHFISWSYSIPSMRTKSKYSPPDRFQPISADISHLLGDIIVQKCVRRHRCTVCWFTLIIRWDRNPTRSERDQAQDQRRNVLSMIRGYKTANFKLRVTTEKSLLEKRINTFCLTWEMNPGPPRSTGRSKYKTMSRKTNTFKNCH